MKDKLKTKRRILRKTVCTRVCVCACLCVCVCVRAQRSCLQGVLVCEEELRRTYLEPEERRATDEEEGRLEGLRHPDLQGE